MSQGNRVVDGYRLLQCIATTKFSQLWEVMRADHPHRLAMKLLLPKGLADPREVKLLRHEAKVLASLEHPNIIRFHSSKIGSEHAFLVLEFFRAPNLKSTLATDLPAVQRDLSEIVSQFCLALAHVHERGWVHRDLKPENVLYRESLGLKLIDFSVAEWFRPSLFGKLREMKSRPIQGTREYIAPETIRKRKPSPPTDIYSLGATLYEFLTGLPPFRGSTPSELLQKHLSERPLAPSQLNGNVTPEMDALVLRMLEKDAAKRPRTAMEVLGRYREISPFREPVPRPAQTASAPRRSPAPESGRRPRPQPPSRASRDHDDDLPMMEEIPPVQ